MKAHLPTNLAFPTGPARLLLKRIVVTALPLILLWGFVACLTLCSDHLIDSHEGPAQVSHTIITGAQHEAPCPVPVTSWTVASRTAVPAPIMVTRDAYLMSPSTIREIGVEPYYLNRRRSSLANDPDPPLERLAELRL